MTAAIIPKRAEKPVVLSPKMLPSTIKKTAIAYKTAPNIINAYCHFLIVIFSPLQYIIHLYVLGFMTWVVISIDSYSVPNLSRIAVAQTQNTSL
jgi:hypothetical protein